MKIATVSEMRNVDANALEEYGIPGIILMENAGRAIAEKIREVLCDVAGKSICIFVGKGNNGGDGCVAARHLYNSGARVKVILVADRMSISGDARTNLDIICAMGVELLEIADERDWDQVEIAVAFAQCLVDALVGTGFYGQVGGNLAKAIGFINKTTGKPVVAIDISSGVDADSGQVLKTAVRATHTVTLGLPKPGLLLHPGAEYTGSLTIADIGIPTVLLQNTDIRQSIITVAIVKSVLPNRRPDAHKGVCGKVAVVAGSIGLTGAAALTSLGALRVGAGLVTLGIASSLYDIMAIKLTEVMTRPLPEAHNGTVGKQAIRDIAEMAQNSEVLALGPGLGRQAETMEVVRELLGVLECPMVLDADALYSLIGHTDLLPRSQSLPVLTPHPGEMSRLTGLSPEEINQDRLYIARQTAEEWGCIVVLKGAPTVVGFPDGELFINTTGNAGMATGGTGDVLTGVIAGLIAQGLSSHWAAVAGVYLHGLAGDIAAEKGAIGLTAGDILANIPIAIGRTIKE